MVDHAVRGLDEDGGNARGRWSNGGAPRLRFLTSFGDFWKYRLSDWHKLRGPKKKEKRKSKQIDIVREELRLYLKG
jgi:hypothetical protein